MKLLAASWLIGMIISLITVGFLLLSDKGYADSL